MSWISTVVTLVLSGVLFLGMWGHNVWWNGTVHTTDVRRRIRNRQRFSSFWLPVWIVDPRRECPHDNRRNIYGDEINAAGGNRSRCVICGRLLADLYPGGDW